MLRALGATDDIAHSSIRFGIGRFSTEEEVDYVVRETVKTVNRLRELRYVFVRHQVSLLMFTIVRCGRWSRRASTLALSTGRSTKLALRLCDRQAFESRLAATLYITLGIRPPSLVAAQLFTF